MSITSKLILRPDYIKIDGTNPIYLRLTINRIVKSYSLKLSCLSKFWIDNKFRVSKPCPNSYRINLLLDKHENKSNQIIFDFLKNDKILTFTEFEKHFKNNHYNNKSFVDFVQDQIKVQTGKLKKGTIKGYKDQLNKLQSFWTEIVFSELTPSFMDAYKQYLIQVRNNNKNTIIKSLLFIKNMLNKALNDGLINDNPCKSYKLGRIEGNREHLTLNELNKLEKLFYSKNLKKNKENVLKYFLFCCYTGLRYSDIKSFKYSDINEDMISIKMHKTEEFVRVPLIDKAKKLLPNEKMYFKNQPIFKVLTNQPTNRYIKDVISIADIKKKISIHCARHTFATVGIDLGIPIDVISKLLGHTDIKTTMIYAKYSDGVKKREMGKWEI